MIFVLVSCGNANLFDPTQSSVGSSNTTTTNIVPPPAGPILPPSGGGVIPVNPEKLCQHHEGENFDASKWTEPGACIFKACNDSSYTEFEKRKVFQAYIDQHGGQIIDDAGLCENKYDEDGTKCDNPRAYNFQALESCKFKACGLAQYCEHIDYLVLVTLYGDAVEHDQTYCENIKVLPGCMDPLAYNTNELAGYDDGTCKYKACRMSEYTEFDSDENKLIIEAAIKYSTIHYLSLDDLIESTCTTVQPYKGCTTEGASNYDPKNTVDDNGYCRWNACVTPGYSEYKQELVRIIENYALKYSIGVNDLIISSTCMNKNVGCTIEGAKGYDATALQDNGSCRWEGCINSNLGGFSSSLLAKISTYATTHGGAAQSYIDKDTCIEKNGCMVPGAIGYSADNKNDDGSCKWDACLKIDRGGYVAELHNVIKAYAKKFNKSENDFINKDTCVSMPGCTQESADNYNQNATDENGTCNWVICHNGSPYGSQPIPVHIKNYIATVLGKSVDRLTSADIAKHVTIKKDCKDEEEVVGCMDPQADNTVEGATKDNGTCKYSYCTDCTYIEQTADMCVDPSEKDKQLMTAAVLYASIHKKDLKDLVTSTCSENHDKSGCTNPYAANYRPEARTEDNSCFFYVCYQGGYGSCQSVIVPYIQNYATLIGKPISTNCTNPFDKEKVCVQQKCDGGTGRKIIIKLDDSCLNEAYHTVLLKLTKGGNAEPKYLSTPQHVISQNITTGLPYSIEILNGANGFYFFDDGASSVSGTATMDVIKTVKCRE